MPSIRNLIHLLGDQLTPAITSLAARHRGSFTTQLGEAIARHWPARVVVTEAGEWRVRQMQASWQERFALPVDIMSDERFLCIRPPISRGVRRGARR